MSAPSMQHESRFLIGTSGWSYEHWRGPFYPSSLPSRDRLDHYAQHFLTVEIDSTFYRLPSESTLQEWHDSVPVGFVFSVKASRYITHMKKLMEPEQTVPALLDRISLLGEKLGPILFQLPPRWRCNVDRLAEFLDALSGDFRYVFEFRDHSWFNREVLELLADHRAAFCVYDLDGFQSPDVITTNFTYVRLHGPGGAYHGCYTATTLAQWQHKVSRWQSDGLHGYCYFDNDEAGYAPMNALSLQSLLAKQRSTM